MRRQKRKFSNRFFFFFLKKKEEKQPTIVHPNGLTVGYLAAFAGSATIIIIIVIAPLPPTVRYTLYLHTFNIFIYSNRMTVADVVVLVFNAQYIYLSFAHNAQWISFGIDIRDGQLQLKLKLFPLGRFLHVTLVSSFGVRFAIHPFAIFTIRLSFIRCKRNELNYILLPLRLLLLLLVWSCGITCLPIN